MPACYKHVASKSRSAGSPLAHAHDTIHAWSLRLIIFLSLVRTDRAASLRVLSFICKSFSILRFISSISRFLSAISASWALGPPDKEDAAVGARRKKANRERQQHAPQDGKLVIFVTSSISCTIYVQQVAKHYLVRSNSNIMCV